MLARERVELDALLAPTATERLLKKMDSLGRSQAVIDRDLLAIADQSAIEAEIGQATGTGSCASPASRAKRR